ncbi:TetR/AcrR family transcriptional regulator [Ancylobacter sp. Lp-2]|uniref:TetR/AcrR family transcriptional regulator n=1 Tax=Ancylobacter sp. Lp-2 TaxID=2881339 RepID=UPI001E5F7DD5|nr:TetR/AcrR family transcriptional regulator [Ancylobacter sp. Lp-2]MCB4768811.1 TetR/AcrR family transcriptional regulator [Ancylobacter sp. Lp-2]
MSSDTGGTEASRESDDDSEIAATERAPARRRRGQLRLKVLIEATDALLAEHDVSEVGLYQIAERAGVPTASIYHFFPNKEAALVALAESCLAEMGETVRVELTPRPATWQELITRRVRAGAAYYNEHPALMKLFLGASISAEVRKRDMAGTLAMSEARIELLDRYFVMPPVPDWTDRVATSLALCDGIWALSYSQHRCITPASIEESTRAVLAYMRLYLPEWIAPRPPQAG